jgi:2-methylcitrate dehydratase PrpD
MIHPRPASGLEAKFSMEYILAAALHERAVTLHSFTDEAVARPAVRELMERVVAREEARLRPEDPGARVSGPAKGGWIEVTVRTTSGREHTAVEHEPHGGPRNPFGWSDVRAKVLSCADYGGYRPDLSAMLVDTLADLRQCPDVLAVLREFSRAHPGTDPPGSEMEEGR